MQIRVICGNEECREEFPVSSEDPEWECPSCARVIVNKRYPFLTARLMQGTIDRDASDWKALYAFLLDRARAEIEKRASLRADGDDLSFMEAAQHLLDSGEELPNDEWKRLHDELLTRAREAVLALDRRKG